MEASGKARRRLERRPSQTLRFAALSLALVLGTFGCRLPAERLDASALESGPAGSPHLSVGCLPMSRNAVLGQPLMIAFAIVNDGDWPVLLRGITAQRESDRSISWLESWRRPLRYDAANDTLITMPERPGADYHRTLYRGLLLPGEALQAYTTVLPYDRPSSHHRFRLDYLAAPAHELLPRLMIADPGGRDIERRFRRGGRAATNYGVARLRRVLMEGRPPQLSAASVPVAITLDPVAPTSQPKPTIEASSEIAETADGLWLPEHGGWAFRRRSRGVVVIGKDGIRRLEHVSLEALRALACNEGEVEVRVIDEPTLRLLQQLGETCAEADGGAWLRIPREHAEDLLALCAREGLWLDAEPSAALPPSAGRGERAPRLRVTR